MKKDKDFMSERSKQKKEQVKQAIAKAEEELMEKAQREGK